MEELDHDVVVDSVSTCPLHPKVEQPRQFGVPSVGGCRSRVFCDERAQAETTLGKAEVLEFPVSTMHGVGVYGHLGHDFSNRGELIPATKMAGLNAFTNLVDQLSIGRDTTSRVEPEANDGLTATHVLVH